MAVSKRLRYEILRRDNHTCTYCGGTTPDVKLTVDHVVPTALGGDDDPSNLTTACRDCNAGKSASSPDAALVAQVSDDALRWAGALKIAAAEMVSRRDEIRGEFNEIWTRWRVGGQVCPLPPGWGNSVENFVAAGLPLTILADCVEIAMANSTIPTDGKWRYACGVAWGKIRELQATVSTRDAQPVDTSPGHFKSWAAFDMVALADQILQEILNQLCGGDLHVLKYSTDCVYSVAQKAFEAFDPIYARTEDFDQAWEAAHEAATDEMPWFVDTIARRIAHVRDHPEEIAPSYKNWGGDEDGA